MEEGMKKFMKQPVIIKSNPYGIMVMLEPMIPFEQLLTEIAEKFKDSSKFFKDAKMAVSFEGRELTIEEEKKILDVITENASIRILCVIDKDKEREETFKKALDEAQKNVKIDGGQYYKGTLRSGQVLETESSIIILGDVNPGATVISTGNIVVLGALYGMAYAGGSGNNKAFVAALDMYATQIRIGDVMARSSDKPVKRKKSKFDPKIAYVESGNIYIDSITKEAFSDMQ